MSRLAVVGDALLDRDLDGRVERLCPDAPAPVLDAVSARERPGGAGLAACLLARDGHHVVLLTALGGDAAGRALHAQLAERGVEVLDLGGAGATPEKVRMRAEGRVLLRLDRDGPPPPVRGPGAAGRAALVAADAVLVSDYGRGVAHAEAVRDALARAGGALVWDPHPRGPAPVAGAALLTPNAAEARLMAPGDDDASRARALMAAAGAGAVAITLGARGALYLDDPAGEPLGVPAPPVAGGDPCGAGDRLASAAAGALAGGASGLEAVAEGVARASAFVAAGGAGSLDAPAPAGAGGGEDVVARVRAGGGRVVATGGCFDLLHAGHVAMLEAARSLGDCLVVLLNSDASVRRLKGPDRPLVAQDDRAAVLQALRCVDAVEVFDEDTPSAALERLRPDVWAKGADYAPESLPEAATVRRHGGEVVVVPYIAGRSTTRLIQEVADRAAR